MRQQTRRNCTNISIQLLLNYRKCFHVTEYTSEDDAFKAAKNYHQHLPVRRGLSGDETESSWFPDVKSEFFSDLWLLKRIQAIVFCHQKSAERCVHISQKIWFLFWSNECVFGCVCVCGTSMPKPLFANIYLLMRTSPASAHIIYHLWSL